MSGMEFSKRTIATDMQGRERGHGPYAGISNRVFIGNLPYNCTEELLFEAFKTVGPVVSARLVFDRDSGKSKGFGFVEYNDAETASSAVRNLQGYEIEGRGLRVDHAEPEKGQTKQRAQQQQQQMGRPPGGPPMPGQMPPMPMIPRDKNGLPVNLPPGMQLPPNVSATDSISQTLATMPPEQLLDIMSQMKSLTTTSPDQARNLLNAHPELAYALFQAMVLMKLVDPSILQGMMAPGMGPPQPMMPANNNFGNFNGPPGPQNFVMPPPMSQPGPQGYGNSLPQNLPPQNQGMFGMPQSQPLPPPPPMQQPPMPQQQPPQAQPINQQTQAALLQQLLAMTQAQIDALPPRERETVLQVRRLAELERGGGGFSAPEAQQLYQNYLKTAQGFGSYNFREYFERQARIRVRDAKEARLEPTSQEFQAWSKSIQRDTQQLQRCAIVNQAFVAPELVIEGAGRVMTLGGGGAGSEASAGGAGQAIDPSDPGATKLPE